MTVGLPGSGIGGIFYILSALWAPFGEVMRMLRTGYAPDRARLAAGQGTLALGIVGSIWLTGWFIMRVFIAVQGFEVRAGFRSGVVAGAPEIFRAGAFLLTFGTLSAVLLSVPVLRLIVRLQLRRARATRPGPPSSRASSRATGLAP